MKNKIIISLIITGAFALTNCSNKDFNLQDPSSISTVLFYKTPADAEKALIAVYKGFYSTNYNNQTENIFGEEVWNSKAGGIDMDIFSFTPSSSNISGEWQNNYTTIAQANTVLGKVPDITFIDPSQKAKILAQAHFFRAWSYFQLVKWYGGVPLLTKLPPEGITSADDVSYPRSSVAEVWAQIESDLKAAIPDLPNGWDADNIGRATKGAAIAYLGKAYIYQKKWAEAKKQFEDLFALTNVNKGSNNGYDLLSTFSDNFSQVANNKWSTEAIFMEDYIAMKFANIWGGGGNSEIEKFTIPWDGQTNPNLYGITNFEDADTIRLTASAMYFYKITATGDTIYNKNSNNRSDFKGMSEENFKVGKYVNQKEPWLTWNSWEGMGDYEGVNVNLFRLPNAFLYYAEALNELGDPATAITFINKVRTRAKVKFYPYAFSNSAVYAPVTGDGSQADVRNAIKHERMVEFYLENEHFPDVLRWGDASKAYSTANDYELKTPFNGKAFKTNKQDFKVGKNELLPIPLIELQMNKKITSADQNAGY